MRYQHLENKTKADTRKRTYNDFKVLRHLYNSQL
jgi:hypothetical protein